ncbi:hypothetical protein NHP200010_07380 [Helicobacter bizzozeronii]|nr:hypothetical protein NHP200010_07380 [Helicobacter bizzozeronii]
MFYREDKAKRLRINERQQYEDWGVSKIIDSQGLTKSETLHLNPKGDGSIDP